MFYGEDGHKPVAVDGTFTVLAFDDTETKGVPSSPETKSPEKKYVIPADQLPSHYSKSELGHSYSFWLPWDEVGGPERRICLVARFEPRKGRPVVSHPSHHVLPGAKGEKGSGVFFHGGDEVPSQKKPVAAAMEKDSRPPAAPATGPVQAVSYDSPAVQPGRREELSTLTIDVPPSFARGAEGSELSSRVGSEDSPQKKTVAADVEKDFRPLAASAATGPAAATSRASATGASPSTRSAPSRFPARRGLNAPMKPDPVRRQPLPATWQSRLPPTPRSGSSSETQTRPQADEPGPGQSPPRSGE
jgi:hypothetical protein